MESNQEERDSAGTDPLLEEQSGKGYGTGGREQDDALEDASPVDDE